MVYSAMPIHAYIHGIAMTIVYYHKGVVFIDNIHLGRLTFVSFALTAVNYMIQMATKSFFS
jgi:hypothetical protein